MTEQKKTSLRRYTDLPSLLHILKTRKISLLDPVSWDDKNDSFFLSQYKEKMGFKTVLALCFSQSGETYHHWRVFSNGSGGVCIEFDRDALTGRLNEEAGVTTGSVRYLTLAEVQGTALQLQDLPFVKRYPYKPESEFRALYVSKEQKRAAIEIPIELTWIRRVTLSPWLPQALTSSVRDCIKQASEPHKISVARSTLISNDKWKALGAGTQ